MKTLLKVLIVVIGCASCQSREQEEISALLETIFEKKIARGDSIYLVQDAVLEWEGNEFEKNCNLVWLKELFNHAVPKSIDLSKIYTEKDIEHICLENAKPYKFLPNQLHPQISLVPKERIDKMITSLEENVKRGGPIYITEEMNKFTYYEKLSRPIFTKNYKYAIIYAQSVCFPDPCVGPKLVIYEKIEGVWKSLGGMNFYLV